MNSGQQTNIRNRETPIVMLNLFQHHIIIKTAKLKKYFVYILTNKYRTTFYIGVTNNLNKRIGEHSDSSGSIFTKKYHLKDLIYYEEFDDINLAIVREKQLKNWKKEWKINLIKQLNPTLATLESF